MAKYKSQATTKYYGIGGTGKVYTNTNSDGLAKSLINAGYKIGEGENKRIDRKKDKAIAKIDELYASGKSFETIQSEILANKHPDLTGKYIEQTTNYHAGKVKAAEVIKEIEANKNKYDYTDTTQSLETFYKEYLPKFESMDKATILGFSKTFNVYKSTEAVKDAENRSAWASEVKISEGVTLIETLPTNMIEAELGNTIKDMQTDVPNTNGSSKPNQLYTNKETLSVLLRSVNKIIAEAKTEDDLIRAEAILNADLGFGKDGTKLGSLGSRNHKEILKAKEDLLKKKRALIVNDRQEKAFQDEEKIKELNASIYEQVEVEGTADGEVVMRDKNHDELMEIRKELEKFGVYSYVANFDRAIDANAYIDTDPAVYDQLIADIFDGKYATQDEVADALVALNLDPKLLTPTLRLFSTANKKGKQLHVSNSIYSESMKYIENAVRGNFTNQQGFLKDNGNDAIRNAHNYMVKELNKYETDFIEKEGREPTDKERSDFMEMMGDIVIKYYSTDYGADPTMKSMTDYETEIKDAEKAEEIKDATYTETGVNELIENVSTLLEDNKTRISQAVENARKFDDSFLGIPFTGKDSRGGIFDPKNFGESDAESEVVYYNKRNDAILNDFLKDVNFTTEMFDAMTDVDYQNFVQSIVDSFKGSGMSKKEMISAEQVEKVLTKIRTGK